MDSILSLYPLEGLAALSVALIPAGFLVGCIPMLIGFVLHGLVGIFKKA